MKIIVIGATGTIGEAVANALAPRHEVIRASRQSQTRVDVFDPASVEALFAEVPAVDAVAACAGDMVGALGPLEQLVEAQFQLAMQRMMSAVQLVRTAARHLRDGGSITVTTGLLATRPLPGTSAVSMAAAGVEGFVRAAALELPRGVRVNGVAPGWVKETMEKLGMDSSPGMPAAELAEHYVAIVEGSRTGTIVDPTA